MCIWRSRRVMQLVGNSLDDFSVAPEQLTNLDLGHMPFSCYPSETIAGVKADRTFGSWPVKVEHRKVDPTFQDYCNSCAPCKCHTLPLARF